MALSAPLSTSIDELITNRRWSRCNETTPHEVSITNPPGISHTGAALLASISHHS